jgi:hypothetical protein
MCLDFCAKHLVNHIFVVIIVIIDICHIYAHLPHTLTLLIV